MQRLMLVLSLMGVGACASAKPGTFFGKPTMEDWEEEKRERLQTCEHDPEVHDAADARRCLGAYQKHRGTNTCVDANAWVSRVRDGNDQ